MNLFAYCNNNPVMLVDPNGHMPKWWQWALSVAAIAAGILMVATGVGAGIGVSLLIAGGSMMASNIMDATGVDSKLATQISAGLNIVAGTALMFTPFAGIGASMIGSGIESFAGGYISEGLGGSYEFGSSIGSIVGGIAGGQIYKEIQNIKAGASFIGSRAPQNLGTPFKGVGSSQVGVDPNTLK